MDSVDLIAPEMDPWTSRATFATRLGYHVPLTLNPGIQRIQAKRRYDLFFTICGFPQDLLVVNAIGKLSDICQTSVCLLDELWVKAFAHHRHFLRILERFDVILLYYSQSVGPLSDKIGRPCAFLPPGVDAILFCPYPTMPRRVIDVYSIGRRSTRVHEILLQMAKTNDLFYLHDSIDGSVINSQEHRALFANVAKRSRYFIVNPGAIDQPERRGNQIEIGNRFFEGAASGTIMLGERPNNEEFKRLFDWPDAVIHVPYDSCHIEKTIKTLDEDSKRRDVIRLTNVIQTLRRHDWVYRWEKILKAVNLESTQGMEERKERLRKLVEVVSRIGQESLTIAPSDNICAH
jgi:hypothetical protein